MRIALFISLALPAALCGRDVPGGGPAKVAEAPNPRLEEVLLGWTAATNSVQQSHTIVHSTTHDRVIGQLQLSTIEAWYGKPGLVRIDYKDGSGKAAHVLCKGKEIRWFEGGYERIFRLSSEFGFPEDPGRYPDAFLSRAGGGALEYISWLSGSFPVRTLRDRFDVRLRKEDEHWSYVELRPRSERDKSIYECVDVVLARKGLRLRRISFRDNCHTLSVFDFDKPDTTTPVTAESLLKGLPAGWKREVDPFNQIKQFIEP